VLHHQGRRSGRWYDFPVQACPTREGHIVALTYDHKASRALDILAAGGERTRGGRRYRITQPRLAGREVLQLLPAAGSLAMRAVGADKFLQVDATPIPTR
jgi:hypothetical protein